MPRASAALTVAHFDLLTWVEQGCPDGVYEDTSHRVSARALHNGGLLKVAGRAGTWTASLTPAGTERLKDERTRIEAQRERERREAEAAAERKRAQQRQHDQSTKVLDRLLQAGGRIDLGTEFTERDLEGFAQLLADADAVPDQQRLAHEPTRMDPDLGWTAYLKPDFPARIRPRPAQVPKQLRGPHAVVTAFLDRRAYVSKAQIPRAGRVLQVWSLR